MSFLQCMLFLIVFILINSISCSTNDTESTTIRSIAGEVADKIRTIEEELEKEKNPLKINREQLDEEKQILKAINPTDVFTFNVGGEIMMTTRETLTRIPKSIFSSVFNGRWEHKLQRDPEGNIFLDLNPILFRHLLDQLQIIEINNSIHLHPPSQPSLVEPFKKMLRKLGLQQSLSSEKKNVITFNVGGKTITNQRTTFTHVSNSTFDTIVPPSKMINFNKQNDVFIDYDPKLFLHLINQLRKNSFKNISYPDLSLHEEKISFKKMLNDLSIYQRIISSPISINTKWKQNGMTIAAGNGQGNQLNQLSNPYDIYVDDDQCIYIADYSNNRVVGWKLGAKVGQVVAGGNGEGNRTNQLNGPTAVILDKKTDSLIICDRKNRRVVRWSRRNGTNGQVIISDIDCSRLTMDNNGDLYVSDWKKHEVRRWKIGERNRIIVAGGNGAGNKLNQLNTPTHLFVDKDHSVYVSDYHNHRVMKWLIGAKEGMVVAGGQGQGNSLTQLYYPQGVIVDHLGSVYVADCDNHRIMYWSKGSKEGRVIVGGNKQGQQSNQLSKPLGISLDRQGHLYVADGWNNRVQKFEIDLN